MPLKYFSNFWRLLEMPLINCKNLNGQSIVFFLQLVISAAGADNSDDIIFIIKGTKLYVLVVTLTARDNQKPSKLFSKGFERSVYWKDYKTKSENKIRHMNIDTFSNQILLEL